MSHRKLDPASRLISLGRPEEPGQPLNVPIVPASTYGLGSHVEYSRDHGTPTWGALEEIVGDLEGGQAVAFSSGMAAVAAVFADLPAGATIALPDDCYQGVSALAERGRNQRRWHVERIESSAVTAWEEAAGQADLLWLESPSNPLLHVLDIERVCSAARSSGTLVAVDNTLATPLNQRPLEVGAHYSVHSATKYFGGHSDLLAGIAVTGDAGRAQRLRHARELDGATPGALEAFLVTRGLRTLALRYERAQSNALVLARFLEQHPEVEHVRYPGLESHPQHELANRVLDGFGAMVSFDVCGGAQAADAVCAATSLVRHATSLGAIESTIERRAAVPGQEHLPPSLLRLSVGCEHHDDLRSDLDQALRRAEIY